MKWIERFETWVNWAVLPMMAWVVLLLTIGFAVEEATIGLALLIAALAGSHWLLRRQD